MCIAIGKYWGKLKFYSRCTKHHVRANEAATAEVSAEREGILEIGRQEGYRIGVFAGVGLVPANDAGLRVSLAASVSAKEFEGCP